jgi:hypothetical protein
MSGSLEAALFITASLKSKFRKPPKTMAPTW